MNLEAIKAKLKVLADGKSKNKRWKPKTQHTVRILPLPGEEDLAYVVKLHYGVDGKGAMYCPGSTGEDCPFCELAEFLKGFKDENGNQKSKADKERDWEYFKRIDASTKHYAPIVERKKDSAEVEGPFLWEMSPKTYTALFKVCADDERNDEHEDGGGLRVLTSLKYGVDVTVTLNKAGTNGNNTSYDLTDVDVKIKKTPVIKNDEKATQELLTRIPTLEDCGVKVISTQEAQKIFDKWEGLMDKSVPEGGGTGVEYNKSANAETVASGGSDVDSAVAKLQALLAK